MRTENVNSSSWQRRLGKNLNHQKKNTVILAVLAVVAVIVGARLLIQPAEPAGADDATTPVLQQGEADKTFDLPAAAAKTGQAARDEYIRQMERRVTKDIFAVDLARYVPIDLPDPNKPTKPTATTGPIRPARSRHEIVLAQAKLLCLQMTIVSDTPTAIINGQVLCVGDIVIVEVEDGKNRLRFRVIKITSHACVVAKDGVTVELRMKK